MKFLKPFLIAGVVAVSLISSADSVTITTIEEYKKLLPYWGASWKPGSNSINGYYPTFYTGFAMRSQFGDRIHIRVSRGNQTRMTVILDDKTLTDYPFDLVKRYNVYRELTSGAGAPLNINPKGSNFVPQLSYYNQIIESPNYDLLAFVDRANRGAETPETMYAKGLNTLRALNPGRVFMLNLNLAAEFGKWKTRMQATTGGDISKVTGSPAETITAINTLVFGRINYTQKPSAEVMAKLTKALTAAVENRPEAEFVQASADLFKAVTGSKYDFNIVNNQGQFQKALQCAGANCTLSYAEFTAIYPTGSVMATTQDEFGNRINSFATPGLWQFISRSGGREVDNIRDEPFYGFIPKMDYEEAGNGFHNPAVRFWNPKKDLKQTLGIDPAHDTFWAVKRGGVSHGCLRLPSGSVWEMRQILPVESEKITTVNMFGSKPQDFDVFDIDGSGELKVMGVEYLISYGLQGTSGTANREGENLEINADKKLEFYTTLYGAKNVFSVTADKKLVFHNPKISMPSYMDFKKKTVNSRLTLPGHYPLYEQMYEQDKIQLYSVGGDMSRDKKMLVRLLGRVRGCAPSSDKQACGEAAFDKELKARVN